MYLFRFRYFILSFIVVMTLILVALIESAAIAAGLPPQPIGLTVQHRSGQTFITWQERTDLDVESYRVYRDDQPISAATLDQADLLYEVAEGSAQFSASRYFNSSLNAWTERYTERYVIEDGAEQLAFGTGLLVWTLSADDFAGGSSGTGYYAVTTVFEGAENSAEITAANSTGAVSESIDDPLPVLVQSEGGRNVFIQYMPLHRWNPTFYAPHSGNGYFGLQPTDYGVPGALQYAFDYVVIYNSCDGGDPLSLPVELQLHSWGSSPRGPTNESNPRCSYRIVPYDPFNTWWFGYAMQHDFRNGGLPTAGDTIANYTEERLLRMIYDLNRVPIGPAVDMNRLYVYGFSMGGSGTLSLSMRYPNVFAAADANKPITNYQTSNWRFNAQEKWGTPTNNLPVSIAAPGGWADHLQQYNGTGTWDWQNHLVNLGQRRGDEIVPLGYVQSISDGTIEYPSQGGPSFAALDDSDRVWGARVSDDGHEASPFSGLPPGLQNGGVDWPFYDLRVVLDEAVPGLGNSSANPPFPPTEVSRVNQTVLWSSSWQPWDGVPIDSAELWQMSLCAVDDTQRPATCGTGVAQTVDVTPRRLQQFDVAADVVYEWQNVSVIDASIVQTGTISADTDGLLTLPQVTISPTGNRVSIRPMPPEPEPTFDIFVPLVMISTGATNQSFDRTAFFNFGFQLGSE
jgi:hypothetical protein